MTKKIAPIFLVACVAAVFAGRPAQLSGSWHVDNGHSDARFTVDGTTNFGKTPTTFTVGFTRAIGTVRFDKDDPTKSVVDFKLYPAGSMMPPIDEDGKVKKSWLVNMANHTLVSFNSKSVTTDADGKLKVAGTLTVTRVDRNVELTPNEAYAGPVYGPPVIHRTSRDATFVFHAPKAGGSDEILLKGSTNVIREDFPQLVSSVLNTYWPPVVEDKKCEASSSPGAEDYVGAQCTGKLVDDGSSLPQAPTGVSQEDYPGPSNFNAVVGQHLNIHVHLKLVPAGTAVAQEAGQ